MGGLGDGSAFDPAPRRDWNATECPLRMPKDGPIQALDLVVVFCPTSTASTGSRSSHTSVEAPGHGYHGRRLHISSDPTSEPFGPLAEQFPTGASEVPRRAPLQVLLLELFFSFPTPDLPENSEGSLGFRTTPH